MQGNQVHSNSDFVRLREVGCDVDYSSLVLLQNLTPILRTRQLVIILTEVSTPIVDKPQRSFDDS